MKGLSKEPSKLSVKLHCRDGLASEIPRTERVAARSPGNPKSHPYLDDPIEGLGFRVRLLSNLCYRAYRKGY